MAIPSEFKAIKELRQIDDLGISPDLLMLFESETESLKVLLSQLASYIRKPVETELIPPGVPQYWPGDTPPSGYVFINNGITFDTVQYPKLAMAWPAGEIPPHKGLVIECTADGAVTGDTESGEVKSHSHNNSHGHLAEFSGNALAPHKHLSYHPRGDVAKIDGDKQSAWEGVDSIFSEETSSVSAGTPSGTVSVGNHSGNTGLTGQSRNTVDRINYNVMVRLA